MMNLEYAKQAYEILMALSNRLEEERDLCHDTGSPLEKIVALTTKRNDAQRSAEFLYNLLIDPRSTSYLGR